MGRVGIRRLHRRAVDRMGLWHALRIPTANRGRDSVLARYHGAEARGAHDLLARGVDVPAEDLGIPGTAPTGWHTPTEAHSECDALLVGATVLGHDVPCSLRRHATVSRC